ncbi:MAG TPA: SPOR domain-containing protein [Gemmatimonadaceae bacterium]|nr:SPOR domain-containing protein [Gemmatimonadaceae bacterium]
MRALLCLAILLVACGDRNSDNGANTDTAAAGNTATIRGPDALFLRIPRAGGAARVVAFPNVDSTVWSSTDVIEAPGRILGFDDDAGVVALLDAKARPVLIDFGVGRIDDDIRVPLTAAVSLDGSTIYGVTAKGDILRRSPSDSVRFRLAVPARGVFPLRDGSVLVWSGRESRSTLSRLRPPSSDVVDSLVMPVADLATGTGVGDRLYFASGDRLQAVQTRTLELSAPIPVGGPITDIAVTPSGDRIYVLAEVAGRPTLVFVDRYRWRIASTLPLDGKPRELRVDPIGRYVLVRGARDSVTVIGVAANRVIGAVRSAWRPDLPLVAPNSSIATIVGNDIVFVAPEDQRQVARVRGGAAEIWFTFWWTGFRPRAAGLDQPVSFDSATVADSTIVTVADSVRLPTPPDSAAKPAGFTVSFFTLLSETRAQAEAAAIRVDNETARVETVVRNGIPMYRVILGPYPTCAEAQRVARAAGKPGAWIPEGGCDVPPPVDEPLAR